MMAKISKIESLAMHDGKGIRCAVFIQGCPLQCACCHNPETQSFEGGVSYSEQEIAAKILRMQPYFRKGGGATFTGGEPLSSADFFTGVAKILKEKNVHIALDTSGYKLEEKDKELISLCDEILLDIKYPTQANYDKYVGGNARLDRVVEFGKYCVSQGKSVRLRAVVVEGINDSVESIQGYAEIAKEICPQEGFELLPFHTMGFSKYEKCGMKNLFIDKQSFPPEKLLELQSTLDEYILRQ